MGQHWSKSETRPQTVLSVLTTKISTPPSKVLSDTDWVPQHSSRALSGAGHDQTVPRGPHVEIM